MLTKRIIPCLDVKHGRVVKGVKFQNLRDAGSPRECAAAYDEAGADEIVIFDIAATPDNLNNRTQVVEEVRDVVRIPLTVGGGVRSVDDGRKLLHAGADKIAVNTAAVSDPTLLTRLSEAFGRQCIVLALDAAQNDKTASGYEVVTHGGRTNTGLCALEWAREAEKRGAGELVVTSWDRDGTRQGYDLALLGAIRRVIRCPLVASGGAANAGHLEEALHAGADAVLAASIFHDGDVTVAEIKHALRDRGVRVRL